MEQRDIDPKDWIGPDDVSPEKMREYIRDLRALLATPGWKYLAGTMKGRYHVLMAGIASKPLHTLDESLAQEYEKGSALMTLTNSQLPEALVSYWEAMLETHNYEEESDE